MFLGNDNVRNTLEIVSVCYGKTFTTTIWKSKIYSFYFFQFFHQFFINSYYCRPLLCIFQLFSNWAEVIILLCWIYSRRIQKKNCWVMMIWWAQLGQVAQYTLQIFIGISNQQGNSVLLLINTCLTRKPYDIYRENANSWFLYNTVLFLVKSVYNANVTSTKSTGIPSVLLGTL